MGVRGLDAHVPEELEKSPLEAGVSALLKVFDRGGEI
jgi:hypothetical protein